MWGPPRRFLPFASDTFCTTDMEGPALMTCLVHAWRAEHGTYLDPGLPSRRDPIWLNADELDATIKAVWSEPTAD